MITILRNVIVAMLFCSIFAVIDCSSVASAETRAVLVGISTYAHQPLPGPQRDVRDIGQALDARGITDVRSLINSEATRSNLVAAMRAAITKSGKGDILVFTFAGHGSVAIDRDSGKSRKSFLLVDFSEKDAPAERFLGEDLLGWARELETKGATFLLILDACHSGIGFRGGSTLPAPINQQVMAARFVPPSISGYDSPSDEILPSNAYVFGVNSGETVREALIDGVERGALSFAFARAVEGAVDRFDGGAITAKKLKDFLESAGRTLAQGQTPLSRVPDQARIVLQTKRPPIRPTTSENKPITIALSSADQMSIRFDPNRIRVLSAGLGDLVWKEKEQQLLNNQGDVIARDVYPKDLPTVADAFWVYRRLSKLLVDGKGLRTKLTPENEVYCKCQRTKLSIPETGLPYVAIFDLIGNGQVQYGYVGRIDETSWTKTPEGWNPEIVMDEPLGADYLMTIVSDGPLAALEKRLEAMDKSRGRSPLLLYEAVNEALAGRRYLISVHERYSDDGTLFNEKCKEVAKQCEKK